MIKVYNDIINKKILFDDKEKYENKENIILLGTFSNLKYFLNKNEFCTKSLYQDDISCDEDKGLFFLLRDRDSFEIYISEFKKEKLSLDNLGFNKTFIDVVGKIY